MLLSWTFFSSAEWSKNKCVKVAINHNFLFIQFNKICCRNNQRNINNTKKTCKISLVIIRGKEIFLSLRYFGNDFDNLYDKSHESDLEFRWYNSKYLKIPVNSEIPFTTMMEWSNYYKYISVSNSYAFSRLKYSLVLGPHVLLPLVQ